MHWALEDISTFTTMGLPMSTSSVDVRKATQCW